jgi:bifunctional non-homologous end joining protein LigD
MQAPEHLFRPFTSEDWIYEIKLDGYRVRAGIEADDGFQGATQKERDLHNASRVNLRTKSGADCSAWFPELWAPLAALRGGPHVIDSEACVLREDGTSDFNLLQERARRRRWYPGAPLVTLACFDLLVHDGKPIMDLPLMERKRRLQELLAGSPKGALLYVGDLPADAKVFAAMVNAGLQIEGVVAKRKESRYHPGVRSDEWRKIKRPGWQEGRIWRG